MQEVLILVIRETASSYSRRILGGCRQVLILVVRETVEGDLGDAGYNGRMLMSSR